MLRMDLAAGQSTDGNSDGNALGGGDSPRSGVFWGRDGEGEDLGSLLISASAGEGRGGAGEHGAREQMLCRDLGPEGGGGWGHPWGPPVLFWGLFDCFLAQEHPGEVGGGGRLSWRV